MQLFSANTAIFLKNYVLPTKSWKNYLQKLLRNTQKVFHLELPKRPKKRIHVSKCGLKTGCCIIPTPGHIIILWSLPNINLKGLTDYCDDLTYKYVHVRGVGFREKCIDIIFCEGSCMVYSLPVDIGMNQFSKAGPSLKIKEKINK